MGNSSPAEAAPAYEDLFHERPGGRTGYAMVGQIDDTADVDIEQAHQHTHGHQNAEDPSSIPLSTQENQHSHCAECDRQRERRERRESAHKSCGIVSRTFILIFFFLMILGVVGIQAWKEVKIRDD
ncbi:hypothetical protein PENANT_c001G04083 [Penicillium antarcticum]|uniref:Uncharacterized protein n=1 Tax=Penicillium antarcticum TaxID=416450 RepID=A0A1V6QPA0_9EURO|nr:uncharacterized protein N7508_010164 [Penicillium antarcticum]KAJ5295343.1 hypothetical protein N7508_010164 [Penicillium antarcticum]OQD91054.1 hypothetical protein PENANT_c001G04083 [Penicillium antarcticum]